MSRWYLERFGQSRNRTGDTRIFSLEKPHPVFTVDDLKSPNTANLTRKNRFFARKDCQSRSIIFNLEKPTTSDIFRINERE